MNKGPFLTLQRIIVLREKEQAQALVERLKLEGAEVICQPLLSFKKIEAALAEIDASFLASFTSICFSSSNAVKFFMEALSKQKLDARYLQGKSIYTVGKQTARLLHEMGLQVAKHPRESGAEGLLQMLEEDLSKEVFLLPMAEMGLSILEEGLRLRGAHVTCLKIYATQLLGPDLNLVRDGDWVLFTSPSTVEQFFKLMKGAKKIVPFSIGKTTTKALQTQGEYTIYTSLESSLEAIIDCLREAANFSV